MVLYWSLSILGCRVPEWYTQHLSRRRFQSILHPPTACCTVLLRMRCLYEPPPPTSQPPFHVLQCIDYSLALGCRSWRGETLYNQRVPPITRSPIISKTSWRTNTHVFDNGIIFPGDSLADIARCMCGVEAHRSNTHGAEKSDPRHHLAWHRVCLLLKTSISSSSSSSRSSSSSSSSEKASLSWCTVGGVWWFSGWCSASLGAWIQNSGQEQSATCSLPVPPSSAVVAVEGSGTHWIHKPTQRQTTTLFSF